MILGPTGSGKRVVADYMVKEGSELLEPKFDIEDSNDNFSKQLTYLMRRLEVQMRAASLRDRRDIVTIRSFFDDYEVYLKTMHDLTTLTDRDMKHFATIYENVCKMQQIAEPPDIVIYMKTPKMSAMNRQALTDNLIHQDFFHKEVEYYEEFIQKIAVPIIEIDASAKPEVVKNELDYGVSSLKAARLGSQTVWRRHFFK